MADFFLTKGPGQLVPSVPRGQIRLALFIPQREHSFVRTAQDAQVQEQETDKYS